MLIGIVKYKIRWPLEITYKYSIFACDLQKISWILHPHSVALNIATMTTTNVISFYDAEPGGLQVQ